MKKFVIIILASLLLLSACGQKGPLYHPVKQPEQLEQPVEEESENSEENSDS
jgi:predicted small lipoprotein YifL